ncbi:PH domain-containing protein [Sulfurimonas sp.]
MARNVFELQLQKVESARLDQSIIERIIGAGTLVVS